MKHETTMAADLKDINQLVKAIDVTSRDPRTKADKCNAGHARQSEFPEAISTVSLGPRYPFISSAIRARPWMLLMMALG